MVRLVRQDIDLGPLQQGFAPPTCGAALWFVGVVRNENRGRPVAAIEYTSYEPMALRVMQEIEETLREHHGARQVAIIHRLGRLRAGERALAIGIAAPHSEDGFRALRFALERVKKDVPIWKKEFYADGTAEWI